MRNSPTIHSSVRIGIRKPKLTRIILYWYWYWYLKVTTKKRETLILNVDGCIAACFVDLLRSCGAFTLEEVRAYAKYKD